MMRVSLLTLMILSHLIFASNIHPVRETGRELLQKGVEFNTWLHNIAAAANGTIQSRSKLGARAPENFDDVCVIAFISTICYSQTSRTFSNLQF